MRALMLRSRRGGGRARFIITRVASVGYTPHSPLPTEQEQERQLRRGARVPKHHIEERMVRQSRDVDSTDLIVERGRSRRQWQTGAARPCSAGSV